MESSPRDVWDRRLALQQLLELGRLLAEGLHGPVKSPSGVAGQEGLRGKYVLSKTTAQDVRAGSSRWWVVGGQPFASHVTVG